MILNSFPGIISSSLLMQYPRDPLFVIVYSSFVCVCVCVCVCVKVFDYFNACSKKYTYTYMGQLLLFLLYLHFPSVKTPFAILTR